MSAKQPEPNPFSREGSEPGDGLSANPGDGPGAEPNRFSTRADGSTPLGQPTPNHPSTDASTPADPTPTVGEAGFPIYGSGHSSGYADPAPDDEAYAAFRGYRASTQNYPAAGVQPYQEYASYPSYPQPGVYGRSYGGFNPRTPNSPYAVPSLVLGIVGVFCAITGPVSLGLGIAAIRQIDAEPHRYSGRGLAIGGIVMGAIGTLWMLLFILAAIA